MVVFSQERSAAGWCGGVVRTGMASRHLMAGKHPIYQLQGRNIFHMGRLFVKVTAKHGLNVIAKCESITSLTFYLLNLTLSLRGKRMWSFGEAGVERWVLEYDILWHLFEFTRKEFRGLVARSWKWVSARRHDAPNWISTWHLHHFHHGDGEDGDDHFLIEAEQVITQAWITQHTLYQWIHRISMIIEMAECKVLWSRFSITIVFILFTDKHKIE